MTPRISVIIPTRNGAATLPELLASIRSQRIDGAVEIVAVDSGSTDGSLDLLNRHADTVIRIPPADFDHGATRNLAIARARADLVVVLVQDACLVGADCLARLTGPFADDATLAGTFARQQPRPDAGALTRYYLNRWAATSTRRRRVELLGGAAALEPLAPIERLDRCTFDHVAACIRRSVWERHPFRPTPIAEDLEWAREVLIGGHALCFVPDAVVIHSHERPARYEFERTRLLHARLHDLFGVETIPDVTSLARAVLTSLATHVRVEWARPARWPRALALAVACPLGQFLGARDARAGRGRAAAQPGRV